MHNGYRCMSLDSHHIYIAKFVEFFETIFSKHDNIPSPPPVARHTPCIVAPVYAALPPPMLCPSNLGNGFVMCSSPFPNVSHSYDFMPSSPPATNTSAHYVSNSPSHPLTSTTPPSPPHNSAPHTPTLPSPLPSSSLPSTTPITLSTSLTVHVPPSPPVHKPSGTHHMALRPHPKPSHNKLLSHPHALTTLVTESEPTCFTQANISSLWCAAMCEEINVMVRTQTWSLVPQTSNMNVVGRRWVFRLKRDSNGNIVRHRARWTYKMHFSMVL
ncbi:hypothetical protein LIER_04629 [Lithospermum erythrorhizon]|uniref:Reverse transcriptase Ty1/copia-type domain-containing protein n=1 Tax=Lithospermum erythrorhizon TaxID=34254 RepID=A0AAV3NYP1_LITER